MKCSNDYLGLSGHAAVRRAAAEAALAHGMGPRGSPLVAGHTSLHRELELRLAGLKGTEDCLLFPTGFAANMAVMTALASDPDVYVFSDELNHASIIDGIRLAVKDASRRHVYRHCDVAHLDELLSSVPEGKRTLVVTDTVFSMDGDVAPLRALADLRMKHGFMFVVDEAHATLLYGDTGAGVVEAEGLVGQVDVEVGTLSKAVGSIGGFCCCSSEVRSWLLNKGRAFVYSTALPVHTPAPAPSPHLFILPSLSHTPSLTHSLFPDAPSHWGEELLGSDSAPRKGFTGRTFLTRGRG